jgi:Zn-dependent peptidase ImmA (M78 family)
LTNLEQLLGIDRDLAAMAIYPLALPRNKWEAIQQGERAATQERRRLGLGHAPLPDISEILEIQGVRTALITLPQEISGVTLIESSVGVFVVANREHHILRRRFSYAHEYCHVLIDRDSKGSVSSTTDRDDLLEVRANAFAASFLMPEESVMQFVYALGKGHPSRLQAEIFDEEVAMQVQARSTPGSQDIQMYDVVQLAHHFGVSCLSAIFRLRNLRLITDAELKQLQKLEEEKKGAEIAAVLEFAKTNHFTARNAFRHRFLGLGLEALRRQEITYAKLRELATMVDISEENLGRLLSDAGMGEGDAAGAYY